MKTCPTCQQAYPDKTESCPGDGARLAAEPARHGMSIRVLLLDLFMLGFMAFGCLSYFSPSKQVSARPLNTPAAPSVTVPQGTQSITHVVKRGESLPAIVTHYLPESIDQKSVV